jgi:putative transposase
LFAGRRKLPVELSQLIEGLALRRPRPSVAAIHRQVSKIAKERDAAAPSYATVHSICSRPRFSADDARAGRSGVRNRYELIHRHRAEAPNALWQADHTTLDILVVDANGKPARPWLTIILDDHSRAVALQLRLGA